LHSRSSWPISPADGRTFTTGSLRRCEAREYYDQGVPQVFASVVAPGPSDPRSVRLLQDDAEAQGHASPRCTHEMLHSLGGVRACVDDYESLHVLFWIGKDLAWALEAKWVWLFFAVGTLVSAADLVFLMRVCASVVPFQWVLRRFLPCACRRRLRGSAADGGLGCGAVLVHSVTWLS
jgi:hypothetical protein